MVFLCTVDAGKPWGERTVPLLAHQLGDSALAGDDATGVQFNANARASVCAPARGKGLHDLAC